MSKIVYYMSMSLDGYVAAAGVSADEPMGVDGGRLHDWIGGDPRGMELLERAIARTGAVIAGRRTYDLSNWGPNGPTGEARVPTVVLTHRGSPPPEAGVYTFVGDVDSAVKAAQDTAGGKEISVGGVAPLSSCCWLGTRRAVGGPRPGAVRRRRAPLRGGRRARCPRDHRDDSNRGRHAPALPHPKQGGIGPRLTLLSHRNSLQGLGLQPISAAESVSTADRTALNCRWSSDPADDRACGAGGGCAAGVARSTRNELRCGRGWVVTARSVSVQS